MKWIEELLRGGKLTACFSADEKDPREKEKTGNAQEAWCLWVNERSWDLIHKWKGWHFLWIGIFHL